MPGNVNLSFSCSNTNSFPTGFIILTPFFMMMMMMMMVCMEGWGKGVQLKVGALEWQGGNVHVDVAVVAKLIYIHVLWELNYTEKLN